MCVSGPEQHLYTCAALLLDLCFYTCAHLSSGRTRSPEVFLNIPNTPPPLTHMCTRQIPSVHSISLQEHRLTSAERRIACHRRSETLTISEFTSAQAQGSARSDRPPNSLVIKDKDTEEGEGERKRDWGKKRGREEKECGYLLSDSPAEMCWDDTSFYIWCVHSVVKPHVPSALLRYCSLLHMWACVSASDSMRRIGGEHSASEWVGFSPCRVMTVSSLLLKHWTDTAGIAGILSASYFSTTPGLGYLGRHDMTE